MAPKAFSTRVAPRTRAIFAKIVCPFPPYNSGHGGHREHGSHHRPHRPNPADQAPERELMAMACIHKEMLINAPVERVWAAVRDVGEVHTRFAREFVVDTRLEGTSRLVTFANGMVVRERIIDIDESGRRLAYAIVDWTDDASQCVVPGIPRRSHTQSPRLDCRSSARRPGGPRGRIHGTRMRRDYTVPLSQAGLRPDERFRIRLTRVDDASIRRRTA